LFVLWVIAALATPLAASVMAAASNAMRFFMNVSKPLSLQDASRRAMATLFSSAPRKQEIRRSDTCDVIGRHPVLCGGGAVYSARSLIALDERKVVA
jgi:hypothetical protein